MIPPFNPFSSRFVRPGALPYLLPDDTQLDRIVAKLEGHNGFGQILGPHGSGKSTLIEAMLPRLIGWEIRRFCFRTTERELPPDFWDVPATGRPILVVDGFEQLPIWTRWRVFRHCRKHQQGLFITAHRGLGFPLIYRTDLTPELALRVIQQLVPEPRVQSQLLEGYPLAEKLRQHRGSLREVLFELYDRWEVLRRSGLR